MKEQVILGIDPGYAIVGFGLIKSDGVRYSHLRHGAITTPKELPLGDRLCMIYDDMTDLLSAQQPDAVSMEKLYFYSNVTTGIPVAEARGVILLSIARRGIPVFEYTPMQIKQAVVGYGHAEKKQVMEMTRALLGLREMPRPDDAADALGAAITHANMNGSQLFAGESAVLQDMPGK